MANLSVTASAVLPSTTSDIEHGRASAAIDAGEVVYKDDTTGFFGLADNNSATANVRRAYGIALNHAQAAGQPLSVQKSGDLTINAAMTAGVAYYLSDTPGKIAPFADIGSGEYVVLLGVAKSTTVLRVDIQYPDVSN